MNAMILLLLTWVVMGWLCVGCPPDAYATEEETGDRPAMNTIDKQLELTQTMVHEKLEDMPEFAGSGIGRCNGTPCVKVHLQRKTPELEQAVYERLAGLNVGIGEVAMDDIAAVRGKYARQLWSIPGVVGLGIGDCQGVLCIHVYVLRSHPEAKQTIPKELEGFKVDVMETEGFKAEGFKALPAR